MARLLNDNAEKRSAHLPRTRCTEAERRAIEAKAAEAGLSLSEYQRQACLEAAVIVREPVADAALLRQLLGIGNNLNQLTRKAHIHDDYDRAYLRDTLKALDAVIMGLVDGP